MAKEEKRDENENLALLCFECLEMLSHEAQPVLSECESVLSLLAVSTK